MNQSKSMRKNLIIIIVTILFFPLSSLTWIQQGNESPVTGYLDITVESNVNKVLFSYPISDMNLAPGNNAMMTNIVVPVKDFRCDNKIAFRDFLTLLKADEYPDLTIAIPWKVIEQLRHRNSVRLRDITINIAGVSKEYDIVCTAENAGPDKILAGTIRIDLSDLDITPPVKYFGMVKIKEEVIVKFGLGFKDQSFARK